MDILIGFAIILGFQLIGDLLVHLSGVPVPGSVIGMVLLLLFLLFRGGEVISGVRLVSGGLLRYLALLFVPAGVGLIQYLGLLEQTGVYILLSLVASSAITLALVLLILKRWMRPKGAVVESLHD